MAADGGCSSDRLESRQMHFNHHQIRRELIHQRQGRGTILGNPNHDKIQGGL
jgi:hypothetical protein